MPETELKIWTVSELNGLIRDLLENSILPVCVTGEVSGLTVQRSGHVYLLLKDEHSQIRGIFFNGAKKCIEQGIENGTQVRVFGRISYYTPRGECQISIQKIEPAGLGQLQQRFEEMKRLLAAEGLFDADRKKPLPFIPRCIGVVTSPEGAAIKDFIKVALQRFPPLSIRVFPAQVQGKGAEIRLAQGIDFFNSVRGIDAILITRGGGSMEDLWPFNEEVLARAIARSRKPVVSAVGHEIDTTICDLVADVRVPTPTAAAEAILPDLYAITDSIELAKQRLRNAVELSGTRAQARLDRMLSSRALTRPAQTLLEKAQMIDELVRGMESAITQNIQNCESKLGRLSSILEKLDPRFILGNGYAILMTPDGKALLDPSDAPAETILSAQLAKGVLNLKSLGEKNKNSCCTEK